MRFIDLAGSERVGKAHEGHDKMEAGYLQAVMINYSLTVFSRVS